MIVAMIMASAILFADTPVIAAQIDDEAAFKQALECRAYTDFGKSLLSKFPNMLRIITKQNFYWTRRSEDLGQKFHLPPEVVWMKSLVIELKSERVDSVLASCLSASSKEAFR